MFINFSPTNRIGYWKMEGNSTDSSGSGNNGSDSNISYVAGLFGQAASFNGSNSKITLPDLLDGATEISLGGWYNGSTFHYAFSKNDVLAFGQYNNAGNFRFRVKAGGTYYDTTDSLGLPSSGWHWMVGTWKASGGANNIKVYKDGVLWGQGTTANSALTGGGALVMGGWDTGREYMNCKFDEGFLYTRELTAAEILDYYTKTKGDGSFLTNFI